MPSVLICSSNDLTRVLAPTLIGRVGIDRFKAAKLDEARLLARVVCPRVSLVDRDLAHARDFIKAIREEPATHGLSIAILASGEIQDAELGLLESGANAIFRLPPDAGWDERMARLLSVPIRQEARLPVDLAVETHRDIQAEVVNLSVGGMLVQSPLALELFEEFDFDIPMAGGTHARGRGRIVRQAGPRQFGVEFQRLDGDGKETIRQFVRSASVGQER
jgi:PilZ domain